MDDIGNLVYILVFIIWFLYRTFGKAGKKQSRPLPPFDPSEEGGGSVDSAPPPGRTKQATPPPMTFEEMLRELTGTPPVAVEEEPEDYYEPDELQEVEEETSFEVLKPIEAAPSTMVTSGKFKEFELRSKPTSKAAKAAVKMFRSPQGAKQAFIMKEIFDRKY